MSNATESHQGNANEPDKVNIGGLSVAFVLSAIAMLSISMFIVSLVRQEVGDKGAERGNQQDRGVRDLKNAQLEQLRTGPVFADREKGLVQIPIDRAIALTLAAVRENPEALSPGGAGAALNGNENAGAVTDPNSVDVANQVGTGKGDKTASPVAPAASGSNPSVAPAVSPTSAKPSPSKPSPARPGTPAPGRTGQPGPANTAPAPLPSSTVAPTVPAAPKP